MPTELEYAYLAGIVDGEGTITITKHQQHLRPTFQFKPMIIVSNTNRPLIEYLCRSFGGSKIFSHRRRPGHRDQWCWRLMSLKAIEGVLDRILPHLIVKRPQALVAREYVLARKAAKAYGRGGGRGYGRQEHECHARIRLLNRSGADSYGAWTEISGFSEAVLDYIRVAES